MATLSAIEKLRKRKEVAAQKKRTATKQVA
jgi:hypothetical protein